jgi:hypothetical protein
VSHENIPVLIYEGDYAVALVLKSILEGERIEVSFEDLPVGGSAWGRSQSRIYVARADEAEARQVVAAFEQGGQSGIET